MFEATLQAKYEFTIILIFFIKKKKLIISTHEVVDGNPMMYKKTFIKLIFFIKKYRGTIKIHYNKNRLGNFIYGYVHEGGEIVPKEDKQIQYNGGQQKDMYIGQEMSYADFVSKACERLNINPNGYTFHYTLEFDPSALQQLTCI